MPGRSSSRSRVSKQTRQAILAALDKTVQVVQQEYVFESDHEARATLTLARLARVLLQRPAKRDAGLFAPALSPYASTPPGQLFLRRLEHRANMPPQERADFDRQCALAIELWKSKIPPDVDPDEYCKTHAVKAKLEADDELWPPQLRHCTLKGESHE